MKTYGDGRLMQVVKGGRFTREHPQSRQKRTCKVEPWKIEPFLNRYKVDCTFGDIISRFVLEALHMCPSLNLCLNRCSASASEHDHDFHLGRGILGGLLSGHQHAVKVLPKYKGGLLNKAPQSRCSREQQELDWRAI